MSKKPVTEVSVVDTEQNLRTSAILDLQEDDAAVARSLGIVLTGTLDERMSRAATTYNSMARMGVEVGYLLLSVKADAEHGSFAAKVEAMGFSTYRAGELMRMAKFVTALPPQKREEMLTLSKSKVLALASADPAVVEQMLEDGEVDFSVASVREIRQHARKIEADNTNLAIERDTLKAERDSLAKQLKRRSQSEEDSGVPIVVLDIRAEAAALVKKAELALTSIYPLGVELAGLRGHDLAGPWVEPSTRLVLAGLVALQVQLAGLVVSYAESIDADIGAEPPAELAHLQPSEVQTVAKEWAELTALHNHEAALRQHDRDAARPRGKGRPASAPQLKA